MAWPVFVISLKRAAQRREASKRALEAIGLPFTFFDAVEGVKLRDSDVARVYDADLNARKYKRPLSRPEIGCYLSHYELWRRIVEDNLEGAVILEDDFEADDALVKVVEDIGSAPPTGALVKLFSRKPVLGATIARLNGERRLVAPNRVPGLTLGYALDRTAAEMLLVNALPFSRPLDMDIKHWWEFGLPVLVVDPPPLRIGELGLCSHISASRIEAASQANCGGMRRFMANIRYQLDYNMQLFHARADSRRAIRRLQEQMTSHG